MNRTIPERANLALFYEYLSKTETDLWFFTILRGTNGCYAYTEYASSQILCKTTSTNV